jgi:putrescine---pyruvate transaminase
MLALDLVSDKRLRTPIDPALGYASRLAERVRLEGVLVRPVGTKIILSPPLTLTLEEADLICHALEVGLAHT